MRVTLITSGHLAACPRMVKAADALHASGAAVSTISVRHDGALRRFDDELRASRRWTSRVVDYSGGSNVTRVVSGARQRLAAGAVRAGARHDAVLARALSRVVPEIIALARAQQADLYYGGATGTLAVLQALAADGARVAVDFEDAHGLEPLECGDQLRAELLSASEAAAGRAAQFCTAAGAGVAGYYRSRHGIHATVIDNVFVPTTVAPVHRSPDQPMRLYWFSQTIGPNRGLELVVDAAAQAGVPLQLTLRGDDSRDYVAALRHRAATVTPLLEIVHALPAAPDDMVAVAAAHDIGLSLEDPTIPHRAVCTPNKLFVSLAAGLAVIGIATAGQAPILDDIGDAGAALAAGDASTFAAVLQRWHVDRAELLRARTVAWTSAQRRWRFDHPCERDTLLSLFAAATA